MSKLLINEPPLQVLPSLAASIGLNEAIVLQQVHYWISNPKVGKVHKGRRYVKNTVEQWEEAFPFWGRRTIQRIFANLRELGLIVDARLDRDKWDRTKWYTVDYEALSKIEECQVGAMHGAKMAHSSSRQNGAFDEDKVAPSLIGNTQTHSETHTQTEAPTPEPTLPGQPLPADEPLYDARSFVLNLFQETFGILPTPGPRYTDEWERPVEMLISLVGKDETKLRVAIDTAHEKWSNARKPGTDRRYPVRSPRGAWKFVRAAVEEMTTEPRQRGAEPGSPGAVRELVQQFGSDPANWPDGETARVGRRIMQMYDWSDPYNAIAAYSVNYA